MRANTVLPHICGPELFELGVLGNLLGPVVGKGSIITHMGRERGRIGVGAAGVEDSICNGCHYDL